MFRGVDTATRTAWSTTRRSRLARQRALVPCRGSRRRAAPRRLSSAGRRWICSIEPHASQYRVSLDSGYDPHDDDVVTGETIDVLRRYRPGRHTHLSRQHRPRRTQLPDGEATSTSPLQGASTRCSPTSIEAAGPGSAIVVTTDHGGVGRGHFEAVDDILETFVVVRSATDRPRLDVVAGVDPRHRADRRRPRRRRRRSTSGSGGRSSVVSTRSSIIYSATRRLDAASTPTASGSTCSSTRSRPRPAPERAGETDALVLAALLHDIGHVVGHDRAGVWGLPDHAEVGARFLQQWLPADVVEPIRRHVAAKRYLVATDPIYRDQLSEASIESLREQGGPFSDEQALGFSIEPFADEAVALRRHDDDGKVDGLDVAPLAELPRTAHAIRQC